jgi:tRNA A-37 threonylcarbamoyl transferase component Bud32
VRAIRRWYRRRLAEKQIAPRLRTLTGELTGVFGPSIRLVPVGAAGRDSIYRILDNGAPVAVVRLINPHRQRAPLPPGSPFIWLADDRRLAHEWHCYTTGHAAGLTPEPLWRCADALVCRYVPWPTLFDQFTAAPRNFWTFLDRATRATTQLHRTGLTHMDASLVNILASPTGPGAMFIDFEYGPAPFVNVAAQRAYDYLRLLESSLKFLQAPGQAATEPWIALLKESVDPETAAANLTALRPALSRLHANPQLVTAIRRVFPGF